MSSEVVSHRLQAQELYQLAQCLQVISLYFTRQELFIIYSTQQLGKCLYLHNSVHQY